MLDQLLNTLTEVLDIREVFDQVSELVQPVLPHDVMGVVELNESGDRFKFQAGAGLQKVVLFDVPVADQEMAQKWDAIVLNDVKDHIFFRQGPAIDAGMKLTAGIPFTLAPVADRIRQDVLILAATEDHFIPFHQTADFEKSLVNARSVTTQIFDLPSGGAERCQCGNTSLVHAAAFDWVLEKFPAGSEQ